MRMIKGNVEREVDASKYEEFIKEGYKSVDVSGDSAKESLEGNSTEDSKNIDGMNLAELRAVAKERGLSGYSSLSKEELASILKGWSD